MLLFCDLVKSSHFQNFFTLQVPHAPKFGGKLAPTYLVIPLQPIEIESCLNPLRMRKDMYFD